jgi:hypothetical protein
MVQMLGWFGASFMDEAQAIFFVSDKIERQDFYGNRAQQAGVVGFVHDPHAALAELFLNGVMAYPGPDHGPCSQYNMPATKIELAASKE